MRLRDRLRLWWRRRRLSRAAKKHADAPLREFVYLDEVSVYSLIAARRGPLATEFTETETSSLRSEVGGSVGASGGIGKAELSSRLESSESRGSQVVRKSIVQATFKDLAEYEQEKMAIRATGPSIDPPPVASAEELIELLRSPPRGHLVGPGRLRRGELLELDIQLEAEPVFRASTVMSTVFEFFDDNPELVASLDRGALGQGEMATRMLKRMLAGLVPIRGRVATWRRISVDGQECLASEQLLTPIPDLSALDPQPIYVVGVAEAELFWKDLRRVLFAESEYFVMCRLARSGLQANWSPVKLVEVLKTVLPDLGQVVEGLGESFLAGMREGAEGATTSSGGASRQAVLEFARRISPGEEPGWTEGELESAGLLRADLAPLDRPESRRQALQPVVEFIEGKSGQSISAEVVAKHRFEALREFGLIDELPKGAGDAATPSAPRRAARDFLLDAEIVAIYW
jgi:hypothetical protein